MVKKVRQIESHTTGEFVEPTRIQVRVDLNIKVEDIVKYRLASALTGWRGLKIRQFTDPINDTYKTPTHELFLRLKLFG